VNYRLVVLTHGESATLTETLRTFHEHVTPKPVDYVCIRDGGGKLPPINPDGQTWHGVQLMPQQGFCAATRAAWKAAVLPGPEYVFWLEHDFRFVRDIPLARLAAVLDERPTLAQLALIRNAVNTQEKKAGGWLRLHGPDIELTHVAKGDPAAVWLEHSICFTTNPSLMRRAWMAAHTWPPFHSECEGRFSGQLREAGFTFGHWDTVESVEHIGVRDGFGY